MTIKFTLKKLLIILLIAAVGFTPFINITPQAQTAAEIQKEIDDQKAQLEATKNDISNLQTEIENSQANLANAEEGLPKLQAELEANVKELELNKKQLELLKQENDLKESIKQKLIVEQQGALDSAYQQWRIKKDSFVSSANLDDPRMNNMGTFLASKILGYSDDGIKEVGTQIEDLNNQINASESAVGSLENKKNELEAKKQQIEEAIAYYNYVIANSSSTIVSLHADVSKITTSMTGLSQALTDALRLEAELAQEGNGGGVSINGCIISDDNNYNNSISFCGFGNDFQQGHQVGMSQWGAYGGANKGMNYEQILKFYYTGVEIVPWNQSSEISIKYCQGNPVGAAYQENCNAWNSNTQSMQNYGPIITERVSFNDYLAGLGEMPDSWPLEARKAQMIAARSYAINFTNNGDPNRPICLTAYCQVSYIKNNDKAEMDAVTSTSNMVMTYQGGIIQAMYSSDNSQGWGTADYETMFQDNYNGTSTFYPYLRGVDDSSFAEPNPYVQNKNWSYSTNTYSMEDINKMMDYVANNSGIFGGFSNYVTDMRGGQKVMSLRLERDASKRVRKVYFKTENGNESVMGAYWFTLMWNVYTSRNGINNSNGVKDWLWSQTFFLHIV